MQSKNISAVLVASALAVYASASLAEEAKAQKPVAKTAAAQPPYQAGRPALKTRPVGDAAVKRTVADAMGFIRGMGAMETNKSLNRLQWIGVGQMTEGAAVYPVTRYSYQISFYLKAGREDVTRTVKGKPERSVRVWVDQQAWDEREPGIDELPASDTAQHRRLQLARTPLGFTRAMLDADQSKVKVVDPGPAGKVVVAFDVEGVPVSAILNAEYRPETITMKVDGKEYVERYRAYKDLSEYGIMFPTKWTETVDGKPRYDITFTETRVASYAVFPKPISSAQAAR